MKLDISRAIDREDLSPQDEYYARTVVVPMGRPDTASEMLRIAGEMVHPVHGLVIALVISLGDVEQAHRVSDQVQDVVDQFSKTDAGHRVELVNRNSGERLPRDPGCCP